MPKYNCMDLKKYGGGVCGVVMQKYFYGFEKMLGGLCQNIFMDLKKCWEGYAKIFYGGVEIVWGVEKCLGG